MLWAYYALLTTSGITDIQTESRFCPVVSLHAEHHDKNLYDYTWCVSNSIYYV